MRKKEMGIKRRGAANTKSAVHGVTNDTNAAAFYRAFILLHGRRRARQHQQKAKQNALCSREKKGFVPSALPPPPIKCIVSSPSRRLHLTATLQRHFHFSRSHLSDICTSCSKSKLRSLISLFLVFYDLAKFPLRIST